MLNWSIFFLVLPVKNKISLLCAKKTYLSIIIIGLFSRSNRVVSGKSPLVFQAHVVLKPLVSLIGRLVACSVRISHIYLPSTVTTISGNWVH